MSDAPANPVLESVVPPEAVPERLRLAVTKLIADWDYSWDDVTFAGTVSMPAADRSVFEPMGPELWVFAITAELIDVGDELESPGGRASGVALSAYSGGLIPATPYQARVFERLGRRGGPGKPAPQAPSGSPAVA